MFTSHETVEILSCPLVNHKKVKQTLTKYKHFKISRSRQFTVGNHERISGRMLLLIGSINLRIPRKLHKTT